MDIRLSWDLFVLVFFVVILAYSFIIGRNNTLKVILGTYVAILAADATGSLFGQYFAESKALVNLLKMFAVNSQQEAIVFVKVLVFVIMVILFSVRGAFSVDTLDDRSATVRFALTILYSIMSAGLIISAILMFVSGIAFVGGGSATTLQSALANVYENSELINTLASYTYIFFAAPALAFLIHSFYSTQKN